jgi:hypothetical protein
LQRGRKPVFRRKTVKSNDLGANRFDRFAPRSCEVSDRAGSSRSAPWRGLPRKQMPVSRRNPRKTKT